MSEPQPCVWCGQLFVPRTTGGEAQRFCSYAVRNCRYEYRQALIAWAEEQLRSKKTTLFELKDALTRHRRSI